MSPILGIYASQISGHLIPPSSFYSIATVTAAGGESSLSFTSIPGTYKSLQIRGIGRTSGTSYGYGYGYIDFNSTLGHYNHYLVGGGVGGQGTAIAGGGTGGYYQIILPYAGSSDGTNIFGAQIVDIIDYASTTKLKTIKGFSGKNANGGSYDGVGLSSALALNIGASTAITSIQMTSGPFGETFVAGTTFALYGIN